MESERIEAEDEAVDFFRLYYSFAYFIDWGIGKIIGAVSVKCN